MLHLCGSQLEATKRNHNGCDKALAGDQVRLSNESLTAIPSLTDEAALMFFASLYNKAVEAAKVVMAKLIPIVMERTAASTMAVHEWNV